jgi:hypothetical protein
MAERDDVLVDTSLWIDFLAGHDEAIRKLGALRRSHRFVICGQIRQEVLQGARDAAALARLEREMDLWDYRPELPEDFVDAARTYARLRWRGVTVPPADCLIAAVAKRCDMPIGATDPHFSEIPGLRLLDL